MDTKKLLDMPPELIARVLVNQHYSTLKEFALTSKFALQIVRDHMRHLVAAFRAKFPGVIMREQDIAERIYHLNGYEGNNNMLKNLTVTIDETDERWILGDNRIYIEFDWGDKVSEEWYIGEEKFRIDGPASFSALESGF